MVGLLTFTSRVAVKVNKKENPWLSKETKVVAITLKRHRQDPIVKPESLEPQFKHATN